MDARRVRDEYAKHREPTPPRLLQARGDVITARRSLSILYGPDRFSRSVAEPDMNNRTGLLVGVGVDRAVLLGMLAWAWPRDAAEKQPEYVRHIVAHAWTRVSRSSHAAPELTDALSERSRTALRYEPPAT